MDEPLARNLRVLRAERGIGLQEAEDLTGVTRETIAALERGQRGVYSVTLRKLAEGYNVSLAELLADHSPLAVLKAEVPDQGRYVEVARMPMFGKWGDESYDVIRDALGRNSEVMARVTDDGGEVVLHILVPAEDHV